MSAMGRSKHALAAKDHAEATLRQSRAELEKVLAVAQSEAQKAKLDAAEKDAVAQAAADRRVCGGGVWCGGGGGVSVSVCVCSMHFLWAAHRR